MENKEKIEVKDIFKLIDLYFKQKYILYSHLHNSFDKFIDDSVRVLLEERENIFFEKATKDKIYRYKFKFEKVSIKPPMKDNEEEILFPSEARTRNLTYSSKLVANVTQIQEIEDVITNKKTERVIGNPEYELPIAMIPIMVKSKYCSLNIKKGVDQSECNVDPGGYFIVKGSEKAVISHERMIENKPLVFVKKDSNALIYTVQVNSKSYAIDEIIQTCVIRIKKDNELIIRVPILNEVPVFILYRALGIETDKDIIDTIVYDENDSDMINFLRLSLEKSLTEETQEKIMSKEEAIDYLINKIRISKKYIETDEELRKKEKKIHLEKLLKENFLPHLDNDTRKKAYYLGYMINRLLQCYLGRIKPDDRDSYANKRIDLPGDLMYELFRQYFKKMLNECNKFFRKRNSDDINPLNIINQIKSSVIELGLNAALLTGNWGKKKGVAQMLHRLTFIQPCSTLRRINSPTVDASTNKLTSPRHLHGTQIGFICPVETPEGHKVGLVKNLSMMGNVSIMIPSQINIIKKYLLDKIIDLRDISPSNIKKYTKVLFNGNWLGCTNKPNKLYNELREMKLNGSFDRNTSIVYNLNSEIEAHELKIYCDGGRLIRPILRVENNELLLKKNILDMIDISGPKSATTITSWNELLYKNPGIIEYIDVEENMNSLIAMNINKIKEMKMRQKKSLQLVKNIKPENPLTIVNRYNDMYFMKYTHCEIHPSMLIGSIASNIPFCNSNQGPRNMFQYSQARQAMGLYITNYRDRLDISYILYNVQKPLVNTRCMKYIGTETLPFGENAIVALACYTGYNQEDSVILNQSAVDRGLYRATSYKKYQTKIEKNQSTSRDDLFIKPDRNKVIGMSHGSYDKLNEFGYAPEETKIENGDIILGKVSPIQPVGGSNKSFKDNSEVYKSHLSGYVDRVWTGIYDNDGYEMRKMRIRSERIPYIGDKMCSRAGQKGTIGITLKSSDMPFTKNGLQPDIIVNPNALPSRMTMGQLIEALVGKVAALEGHQTDGTPFNDIDIEEQKNKLEKYGFDRNGVEEMYNGMTGQKLRSKIFICPTYYQRLKHMVKDKIHARAKGPRTLLTRQPPEGRSRDGGLRFGEMERDSIIAHGMALFLKERTMETADAYETWICDKCGFFARRMLKHNYKSYSSQNDIFYCPACNNKTDVSKIRIPYAFKLLIQELMSINIATRIRVNKNKFNS